MLHAVLTDELCVAIMTSWFVVVAFVIFLSGCIRPVVKCLF